jgi:hypothetical protein
MSSEIETLSQQASFKIEEWKSRLTKKGNLIGNGPWFFNAHLPFHSIEEFKAHSQYTDSIFLNWAWDPVAMTVSQYSMK